MLDTKELLTIRDFLRFSVSRFNEAGLYYGHGTESAWDEAVALILHTLYLPHDMDAHILDARITSEERILLNKMIEKRIHDRIPVPYLTHEAWFAKLPFYVDERVLIPRSPLAELIENHFEPWIEPSHLSNVLELCTGSGCIAIAIAKTFPECKIDASDISEEALAVAKINIHRHHVEDQITLYQSDLFEELGHKKYDLIISNPPYVDASDMAELPPEFKHEPQIGLAGGQDGLDIVLKILKKSASFLNPQGFLIVEVGNSEIALAEKFPDIPFTWLEFERGGGGVFLLTAKQLLSI